MRDFIKKGEIMNKKEIQDAINWLLKENCGTSRFLTTVKKRPENRHRVRLGKLWGIRRRRRR